MDHNVLMQSPVIGGYNSASFDPISTVAVAVLLFALSGSAFSFPASADSFDGPLEKKVVDFGPSPYYPTGNVRIKLSCYFYPTFMVKQYDEGEKGAEWLAIVPVERGGTPLCSKSHARNERVIEPAEWSGYFRGVKGTLVFFDADDGLNGGMPFVVYDARTGERIFRDSYFYSGMWSKKFEDSPFNDIQVEGALDGQVLLKYLRVAGTKCDLHGNGKASCWEPTRKKLGIKTSPKPLCAAYEDTHGHWASAIAYPVEVALLPKPVIKNIEGPIRCWPVD